MPSSNDAPYDTQFKIVLVGDAGVGKTNMLGYYKHFDQTEDKTLTTSSSSDTKIAKTFSNACKPTVGVEFATKIVTHPNGTRIKAQLWDTAGQERYRAITKSHYRRAAGALLVFDVTSKSSFASLPRWIDMLRDNADYEKLDRVNRINDTRTGRGNLKT